MQLAGALRKAIAAGKYPPGTATPSITTLSQDYGHARQTCSKALGVLVKEGLLIAGGWRVDGLRAFDAFPMTHHVECVVTLSR